MHPPLEELFAELNVESEDAPSDGGHRQKHARPYRPSGEDFQFRNDEPFRSDKPPMSKRAGRSVALFLFAVLIGVGVTLASQPYRDEIIQAFPPLGWLSPISTMTPPVPAVTTADLQEQLKPLTVDLALMRRSVEQLGSKLDQLARKEDQVAQDLATLQAAEQQITQKGSAPPPKTVSASASPPKAVHAPPPPPPKSLQPPAQ